MIKATELALIALIAKESLIMTYTPLLAKYMAKYEINTKQRKSAFIATNLYMNNEFITHERNSKR